MPNPTLPDLPPGLAQRPRDLRRGLPIPVVNERPDGCPDFAVLNGAMALKMAGLHRCSLCGRPLEGPAAFLGGPVSAKSGHYSDPPMHEDCAEAALTLCPHIARPHARRASERRISDDATVPVGFTLERPEEWVMVIASSYLMGVTLAEGGGVVPLFVVVGRQRQRRFVYADGVLAEQSSN
ncbi:hypothetical protein ACIQI7_09190 [Kitasatospora sp. NPDC092039]|uniref:hypothetical protein n=1 Tax=Kitasatospora sp. NPDC092039 TaxID=3364086 RepID=UPI003826ADAF